MRQIKFKYFWKHKISGEILWGEYDFDEIEKGGRDDFEISGYSIIGRSEFTGLKDKNGKEIYEGDIVKWGKPPVETEERIAEVKMNPDIQFDCKNIKFPHVFNYGRFIYTDTEKHLEVIGNIYQNPELLIPSISYEAAAALHIESTNESQKL